MRYEPEKFIKNLKEFKCKCVKDRMMTIWNIEKIQRHDTAKNKVIGAIFGSALLPCFLLAHVRLNLDRLLATEISTEYKSVLYTYTLAYIH